MTLSKLNLEITTKPMADPKQTGMPSIPSGVLTASEQSKAIERLQEQSPSDIDNAILSSMKQHGVFLTPRSESRFPTDGDSYEVFRGYDIYVANDVNSDQAVRALAMSMQPMPVEVMEKSLLTTMMLMVKPSNESPKDAALRCKLYANEMREWPADIFNSVLKSIKVSCTFWPAFSEFNKYYEQRAKKRNEMVKAVFNRIKRVDS